MDIQDDRLRLITDLQQAIHDCIAPHISDDPIAIVDFPDIRNPGDSAIWLGQIGYLARWHGRTPDHVARMRQFSAEDLERDAPTGPIFIQGGGTFGDIWVAHQDFRERLMERFAHRPIVQFAQSIHFQSQRRLDQCARAIDRHGNVTLFVRDRPSQAIAEKHFDCAVHLCPDMAFCVGPLEPAEAQTPILALLRTDKERAAQMDCPDIGIPVVDWITESQAEVDEAKAAGAASAVAAGRTDQIQLATFNAAARHRLDRGVGTLSRGATIVTDRLHAHILSLLLGRPHAVLDNSYGKVFGFIDAFSGDTDLTYKAQSLADALAWARGHNGAGDAVTVTP